MTITIQQLVQREVHYCVSSLVSALTTGAYGNLSYNGEYRMNPYLSPIKPVIELCNQAAELSSPIPDYEEAARDAGWEGPFQDTEDGQTYFQDHTDDMTWACDTWYQLCEDHDIDPYDREVFEHWIVSDWLADKLIEKGEKVDKDFQGMTVWARTTTGQAIFCDWVIEQIYKELTA